MVTGSRDHMYLAAAGDVRELPRLPSEPDRGEVDHGLYTRMRDRRELSDRLLRIEELVARQDRRPQENVFVGVDIAQLVRLDRSQHRFHHRHAVLLGLTDGKVTE
jgi:hypothetical protein